LQMHFLYFYVIGVGLLWLLNARRNMELLW